MSRGRFAGPLPMGARGRPPVTIRQAQTEDVPVLADIIQRAYRGQGGWTTEADLVGGARAETEELQDLLGDPDHLVLVAEREGRLVGCCYTHRHGDGAEFGLFAVDPDVQGGGIGDALLSAQVERRTREGLRTLDLRVLEGRTELASWYERRGFRRTGELAPFAGRADDLLVPGLRMEIMVRDLGTPSEI